jgi:hypothetical protein
MSRRLGLMVTMAAVAAGCGGTDYTADDVVDELGLEEVGGNTEGIPHYALPDSTCEAEEIIVGGDRVEEYLAAASDTVAANPDETAGVQTEPGCVDEFEQALEALD